MYILTRWKDIYESLLFCILWPKIIQDLSLRPCLLSQFLILKFSGGTLTGLTNFGLSWTFGRGWMVGIDYRLLLFLVVWGRDVGFDILWKSLGFVWSSLTLFGLSHAFFERWSDATILSERLKALNRILPKLIWLLDSRMTRPYTLHHVAPPNLASIE